MRTTNLFLISFFISNAFSQVIVLQQGLNGYSGCKDSYIMHSDYEPIKLQNFGDADSIYVDICYN